MKKYFKFIFVALLLTSCNDYPTSSVLEGSSKLIVYKVETTNGSENGKYRYAISDNSKVGWTFVTNKRFNIGDTIQISK